ncbi:MAG: hypothetical protein SLAVMIC_00299 [uncultured marine phage]|uniref:Uncharacterized protein n=1 Tax=uncultured marine phage TaxID=707152 RepID=A0A8D9FRF4_9VIRU|nr:MAG: hypothetical protein SLAVMIC_00299 [uncultured marine phage]
MNKRTYLKVRLIGVLHYFNTSHKYYTEHYTEPLYGEYWMSKIGKIECSKCKKVFYEK